MDARIANRVKLTVLVSLSTVSLAICTGCEQLFLPIEDAGSWVRHTIDDQFGGADGVKLGDVDGDDLTDLVVGWEEGGAVVVYLNPGPLLARIDWPAVTVGEVDDVEDAVFVDLDDDGRLDVVSCCQGDVKTIYVHWGPDDAAAVDDFHAWQTEPIPATTNARAWMFCEPADIDADGRVDLVAGAKGDDGQIGVLIAPSEPRALWAWTWWPLADAAWIMSIIPIDLDDDGDIDIVYTDRKGDDRGCYWLENPGNGSLSAVLWRQHLIGTSPDELMFMDLGDLDGDGRLDVVVATDRREILAFAPLVDPRLLWLAESITWSDRFGTGKSVRIADVDLDRSLDIVFACENAGGRRGVGWLSVTGLSGLPLWSALSISDTAGSKFDLIQLLDVDQDGDLDAITTEESAGLGVVWYENPTVSR